MTKIIKDDGEGQTFVISVYLDGDNLEKLYCNSVKDKIFIKNCLNNAMTNGTVAVFPDALIPGNRIIYCKIDEY